MNPPHTEYLWHVTVLSNFARAYNKYTRTYSKAAIPESTYPDRFFLLRTGELDIGIRKAGALLTKLALPGNRLIALGTRVSADQLKPNTRTGLGQYVESSIIHVDEVALIEDNSPDARLISVPIEEVADYANAGLRVLAISRHHHDADASEQLMSLRTDVASIAHAWNEGRTRWPYLRLRFTCVLQKGCIDRMEALEAYIDWTSSLGVTEVCFKELYVSTSVESVYHRHAANEWSHANQVPLSLVLEFAARHGFEEIDRLPWGSPVFSGHWKGRPMQIAAYTEPSLFWERAHGIARSWNLMSDGRCLVSLEDRASEISFPVAA